MNSQIIPPLTAIQTHLTSLLTSITTTPAAGPSPRITSDFLAADSALTAALSTLRAHQANYARIVELRREVDELETRIKDRVIALAELRSEALAVVDSDESESDLEEEDEDVDEAMTGAEGFPSGRGKDGIDYRTLMAFARRIGHFPNSSNNGIAAPEIHPATSGRNQSTSGAQALGQNQIAPNAPFSALTSLDHDTTTWLNNTTLYHNLSLSAPFPDPDKIRLGLLGQVQLASEDGQDVDKVVRRMLGLPESAQEGGVDETKDEGADMGGMMSNGPVPRRMSFGANTGRGALDSAIPRKEKKVGKLELWDSESDEED